VGELTNKFYLGILTTLLILLSIIPGCAGQTTTAVPGGSWVKDATSQEAFKLIQDNKGKSDFIILDVRTPEEFAGGHIEGAINISTRQANFNAEIEKLNKNNTYLVYCRTGNRSTEAVGIMTGLHFTRIYHMVNGITEWTNAGLPVVQ
jgi:rhodanese-related sulfurtransferase